jgi:hypothetical protein
MPVSAYSSGRAPGADALVLGFGAVGPEALDAGMEKLAAAIEAARRPWSSPTTRRFPGGGVRS